MSSARRPLANIVREFHAGAMTQDVMLERALRLKPSAERRSGELPSLLHRFGNQNFAFGTLAFRDLREIFRAIALKPADLFCDAGAGYGHAVFYGACVADCRFRAIEILPVRCRALRKTAQSLSLTKVEIIEADALAQDYADVSHLFVNNPFFPDAASTFVDRLTTSRKRKLTVIALHNIVDVFRGHPQFEEIEVKADLPNYCFGVFIWKPSRRARAK
jgi:Histone methylation protein DOT1